ncbi:MAG: hypothetical protein IJ817_03390, partial [Clostridia bacterium]|nr:hypothetical protein [Clostridia bacterium]
MKVCKFGGSCTTTKESLENIQKIAKSKDRCVFVFSAIGKTCFDDKKLTDLLINFYEEKNIEKKFDIYKKIYAKTSFLSKLTENKTEVSRELKSIWKSKDKSFVVSRGEYITTKIVSEYLKLPFVPAEKIIFFDNGKLDERKTTRKLNFFLKKHGRFCTCGFYGFDAGQKKVVLFERGGGDITGAIIAKLANAPVYENYTDVCGVKTINPKLIPDAKTIKKISYK